MPQVQPESQSPPPLLLLNSHQPSIHTSLYLSASQFTVISLHADITLFCRVQGSKLTVSFLFVCLVVTTVSKDTFFSFVLYVCPVVYGQHQFYYKSELKLVTNGVQAYTTLYLFIPDK